MVNRGKQFLFGTILGIATISFGCLEQQGDYPSAPVQTDALPPPPASGQNGAQKKVPEVVSNLPAKPPPPENASKLGEDAVVLTGEVIAGDDVSLVGKTIQVDLSGYGDQGGGYFGSVFLTQPGTFEIRAPRDAGTAHFTVYVGDAGAGPADRLSCIFEPFDIGSDNIDGIELKVEKDKLMKVGDMPKGQPSGTSSVPPPEGERSAASGFEGPPPGEGEPAALPDAPGQPPGPESSGGGAGGTPHASPGGAPSASSPAGSGH